MEEKRKNADRINCFKCIYFAITWEPAFPKSCGLFGFKSAQPPSVIVQESTGAACLGFVAKDPENKK